MTKCTPSFLAVALLSTACSDHSTPKQENTTKAPSTSSLLGNCKSHSDCSNEEVCFHDGLCALPWLSYFFATDCSLHISDMEQGSAAVWCSQTVDGIAGPRMDFMDNAWTQCQPFSQIVARRDQAFELHCTLIVDEEKRDLSFSRPKRPPLCLDEKCSPMDIGHLRGEKAIELKNDQGDRLVFRLQSARP